MEIGRFEKIVVGIIYVFATGVKFVFDVDVVHSTRKLHFSCYINRQTCRHTDRQTGILVAI